MGIRRFFPPAAYPTLTMADKKAFAELMRFAERGEKMIYHIVSMRKMRKLGLVRSGEYINYYRCEWLPTAAGLKLWNDYLRFN